jgi:hypothetical protein
VREASARGETCFLIVVAIDRRASRRVASRIGSGASVEERFHR